jgi:hypothetical protein
MAKDVLIQIQISNLEPMRCFKCFSLKRRIKHSNSAIVNQMTEQRKSLRLKSLYRGVVSFGDNNFTFDCMVRDISETGARLRFGSAPAIISEYVDLNIPIKGRTFRGKVVWCNGTEMGVAFETYAAFGNSSDDELSIRVARLEAEIVALKQLVKRLQRNAADKTEAA